MSNHLESPNIFFISHYHARASEVWLARIRTALQRQICGQAYFDVGEACDALPLSRSWWRWLCASGLVSDLKYGPPNRKGLVRAIRNSGANIIYCHYANLAVRLASCWHDLDVPVVVHCHGFDVSFDLMKRNGKRKYSDRYKEKIIELSRRCWLIANSEFTQDRLVAQGVPRERILVWHFGVPRLEPLGSGDAVKQILFLGRFVGFKGPTETLRAFAIARERGLLANLVMAGAGPLLPASQRLVEELGIQHFVSFRGTVDQTQAAELFQKSHVFTAHTQQDQLTNQCEAFGVAFAEAMAAGLPVVTGNHAGPSTFLTHEKNALLFTPGNIEGHAKLLQQISTDEELRSRLAWNAIRTAEHDFNLTQQHDKLLDLLSNLARGSR